MLPIQNTAPDVVSKKRTPSENADDSEFMALLRTVKKKELGAFVKLLMPYISNLEMRQPRIWGDQSRLNLEKATIPVNDLLINTRSGYVTIKEDCFFGHRCMLLTGTHDYKETGKARLEAVPDSGRDITLERGVWLGSDVTVLPCAYRRKCSCSRWQFSNKGCSKKHNRGWKASSTGQKN